MVPVLCLSLLLGACSLKKSSSEMDMHRPVKKEVQSVRYLSPDRHVLPDTYHSGSIRIPIKYRMVDLPVRATELFEVEGGGVGLVIETTFTRDLLAQEDESLPFLLPVQVFLSETTASAFTLREASTAAGWDSAGKRIAVWHGDLGPLHHLSLDGEDLDTQPGPFRLQIFLWPRKALSKEELREIRKGIEDRTRMCGVEIFLSACEAWYGKRK